MKYEVAEGLSIRILAFDLQWRSQKCVMEARKCFFPSVLGCPFSQRKRFITFFQSIIEHLSSISAIIKSTFFDKVGIIYKLSLINYYLSKLYVSVTLK